MEAFCSNCIQTWQDWIWNHFYVWFPYPRKDIFTIEGVHWRFTGLFCEIVSEQRLNRLDHSILEFKWKRGVCIKNLLIGFGRIDARIMFPLFGKCKTRSHSVIWRDQPTRSEMERNVLTQKAVNLWNSLRKYAAEAQSRPSIQILRCKAKQEIWV